MALKRDDIVPVRQRKYFAKDFDALRAQILEYARLYYPDRLRDFSESSLGGLLLDMAAYVGDNMSFYLDHQYGELNSDTAVETINIQRNLRAAGVPIVGASPALVVVNIYLQIPAINSNNVLVPSAEAIPIVRAGSIFSADNGTNFILLEDVDFSKKKSDGGFSATLQVGLRQPDGTPRTFIMIASGLCVSGTDARDSFSIGNTFIPFRELTLSNADVTEITSVVDDYGNVYEQVGSLTHDVVYKNVLNTASDNEFVKDTLKVIPAPYRYITNVSLATRKTTLTFGGGSADTLEDDVIPDPSDFAISFPYTKTFSRTSINPQQLLQTKTLGVATVNTSLTVNYRYGGGLSHNVPASSIRTIKQLEMFFPSNPAPSVASAVRNSIEVLNPLPASGGEDAPTAQELSALVPSVKNSQERIVSKEDLLARVYAIPSNFGRVFRAAVRSNPSNPLATQLYVISRNSEQKLITSPDTLKQNLQRYLNPYRLISDAIDILDARVVNLTLQFEVMLDPALNRNILLKQILTKLQDLFNIKNFHIDQPIIISDVVNSIFTVQGVMSVDRVEFRNINNTVNNRQYSASTFDVSSNTRKGVIIPPPGGIFEIKYPEVDIIGRAV
jgi:hypothetical protein